MRNTLVQGNSDQETTRSWNRSDRSSIINHLDLSLPLRYAVQDLYSTDPTQDTAPIRPHQLDHADHTDHTDHTDQEHVCPERSRIIKW